MAIATLTQSPVVGEPVYRLRSGIVDTADVKKGMVLIKGATGAGYVQPATAAAAPILGVAFADAAIGERVTYIIAPCDVRVLLTESQTITAGDYLISAVIAIDGVTTPGYVGEVAVPGNATAQATGTEVDTVRDFFLKKIGYALEDKSTTTDEGKVLKIRLQR